MPIRPQLRGLDKRRRTRRVRDRHSRGRHDKKVTQWPGVKCIFNTVILGGNAGVAVYISDVEEIVCQRASALNTCRFIPTTCTCVCIGMSSVPSPSAHPDSFNRSAVSLETAVFHSRFYNRVNPTVGSLILQYHRENPRSAWSIGFRPISRAGRFSCNSSISIGQGIVAGIGDRCRRDVRSSLVSDWTLLYWTQRWFIDSVRFSRRAPRLTFTPFTILLAHPPSVDTSRSSSNRFLLLLSNCRMLYSQRGRARLGRASNVGIRYAINDGRLLFHDGPIDTLVLPIVRDRSDDSVLP